MIRRVRDIKTNQPTMKIREITPTIGLMALTLVLTAGQALGQAAATPPPPQLSDTEQWIKDVKNPTPWFNWGADLRLRNEYFDNARSLSSLAPYSEQDYFRIRARVWASVVPSTNFDFNTRVTTEPRIWMKKSFSPFFRDGPGHTGWETTEGIIDNLNFRWKNGFGRPMTLSVGRQDMMLGDGWLVGDGTPGDGSRTYFFDSARLNYALPEYKTSVDMIGILQQAANDAWLPPINHLRKPLTDQNEHGAILWVNNKSLPNVNIDAYFIYKHDTPVSLFATAGDAADIYTFGARFSGDLGNHFRYRAEGAYQLGEKRDPFIGTAFKNSPNEEMDLESFGVNTRVSYLFKDQLNNQVHLSYEYLRGDDPDTKGKDEMFDSLWGRWPQWSELYIYSYAGETRMSQIANLHRIGPGWSISPTKKLDFTANYYALFADQQIPTRGRAGLFSNDDTFRGHFVQGILRYKFNTHLAGHLWSEFVFPKEFYARDSMMAFLRAEIFLTF